MRGARDHDELETRSGASGRARLGAAAIVTAFAAALAVAAPGRAQVCEIVGPGTVACDTTSELNGTTTTQVFSPGSRIVRVQELSRFLEERREEEATGPGAGAVAQAIRDATPSLAALSLAVSHSAVNPIEFAVFADSLFVWEDQEATAREPALDTDRQVGTVGFAVGQHSWTAAIALDYLNEDGEFGGGSTERDEIGVKIGSAFGLGSGFYAFGGARYADVDLQTERTTVQESPGQDLRIGKGEADGTSYSLAGGVGFVTGLGARWYVGTAASLSYLHESIDAFDERFVDSGGTSFRFEDDEQTSIVSRLEFEAVRPVSSHGLVVMPSVNAAYLHEFANNPRTLVITAIEEFLSTVVRLRTNAPDRNYFNLGAGVEVRPTAGRWSVSADYAALVGHRFLDQHTLSASFSWSF